MDEICSKQVRSLVIKHHNEGLTPDQIKKAIFDSVRCDMPVQTIMDIITQHGYKCNRLTDSIRIELSEHSEIIKPWMIRQLHTTCNCLIGNDVNTEQLKKEILELELNVRYEVNRYGNCILYNLGNENAI